MLKIRHIQPHEVPTARRLIYLIAHEVYNDTRSLEESIAFYDSKGVLEDMDDIQKAYFENKGTFLVMVNRDQIIGTGAIRRMDNEICELKHLWFLKEYRGRGLGYRMTQELLSFARDKGYQRVRLATDPVYQKPALDFYKRLGFYEIPKYGDYEDDIALEILL
jgi:putative acetyltransferase